jgi:leader peptidase (prepilin peptidase)/N-methyltransferase
MENIPIVSWLLLRGKCRGCGNPISFQYPLVEIIIGAVWLACYLRFGMTFTALRMAVIITVLIGIAVTDLKRYLIPDGFTVFGLIWVMVTAIVALFLGEDAYFANAYQALLGACVGAGAIAIAGWLGELAMKKEAMGFGDVTLMAMVGAAVGPDRALMTIFVGALIGAVVFLAVVYPIGYMRAKRSSAEFDPPLVPFGVFIAPAALVALLWGNQLISLYTSYTGL